MMKSFDPTLKTVAIAPMMDCTDRHYRYFARLLSQRVRLFTEMVTTGAILFGDRERFLKFNHDEHPVVLQVGGSDAEQLAECADIAEQYGYDEINLNVGCPSDRVQAGRFGACLMLEAELVAACVDAMQSRVSIPVTVKCRIGVDQQDPWQVLPDFVDVVSKAGCNQFSVHARKAWLKGLSPKENREIPPLDYDCVYALKQSYPSLGISINGGIETLGEINQQLATNLDGVMIGRAAYNNPFLLASIDSQVFGDDSDTPTRDSVLDAYIDYVMQQQRDEDVYLKHMARHLLGLYHGQPGAKAWRKCLSEGARYVDADSGVIAEARHLVGHQLAA